MPFDPSTAKPLESVDSISKQASKEFDPSTAVAIQESPQKQQIETQTQSNTTPIDTGFKAAGKGIIGGLGDAGIELADLAGDILSKFSLTKKVGKRIKELTPGAKEANLPTGEESEYPLLSSIGRGVGYTAGYLTAPTKIIKGAGSALKQIPGVGSLMTASPNIIKGAVSEGTSGALAGAAMQPDSRGSGAVLGGALGGAAGAVGGALSPVIQRLGRNAEDTLPQMNKLDFDLSSPEAIARARYEVASRGKGTLQDNIESQTLNKIQQTVDEIKPNSVNIPQKSPSRLITARLSKNFQTVEAEKRALYQPLEDSQAVVPIELKNLSKSANAYLPNEVLSKQASFRELQDYRQKLDISIRAAKNKLIPKEVEELKSLRKEITTKMEEVSNTAGLGDQFKQAESFYRNEYLPFRTFDKSGRLNSPEAIDNAWQKVNQLLTATNPKPKELRALINSLGDEGKDIIGWASIQNALNKSTAGNQVNIGQFNRSVNKLSSTGLDKIISKPEYRHAIQGINRLVSDGKKALNVKTYKARLPVISDLLNNLMESEAGIKLLIKFGSSSKNSKQYREALQQLMTQGPNVLLNSATKQPKVEEKAY